MQILDLNVEKRDQFGSSRSRRYRRAGRIPCMLYGSKQDNVPLLAKAADFDGILKAHSALVRLKLGAEEQTALLREVKWDFLGEYVEHVDLVRVEMSDEVKIKVPVHAIGIPAGAGEGGELQVVKAEIEVLSRVDAIPTEIRIDVSALKLFDGIHVNEITYPPHVRPAGHERDLVVHCVPPRKVEEAAPAAAEAEAVPAEGAAPAAPAEPVVEPKGKEKKEKESKEKEEGKGRGKG
jgi:large subunit ribosomal protein L25